MTEIAYIYDAIRTPRGKGKKEAPFIRQRQFGLFTLELCWRNRRDKLGKLSLLIGVYHDQENQNL